LWGSGKPSFAEREEHGGRKVKKRGAVQALRQQTRNKKERYPEGGGNWRVWGSLRKPLPKQEEGPCAVRTVIIARNKRWPGLTVDRGTLESLGGRRGEPTNGGLLVTGGKERARADSLSFEVVSKGKAGKKRGRLVEIG